MSFNNRLQVSSQQSPPDHPRGGEERGQVIVLTVLSLIVLVGLAGFVIDVGHAYQVSRQLQGAADAAALAGAVNLPDGSAAVAAAKLYGVTPGNKNAHPNLAGATETITATCVTSLTGCYPSNVLKITESINVDTTFLKVLGVNTIPITIRSTACGPCGGRPADIVLVFDRTGSMCMDFNGNNDPSCAKLENARQGMLTLLKAVDPAFDRVALVELPPASGLGAACSTPVSGSYDSRSSAWLLAPLSNNYQNANKTLNNSSAIVSTINCTQAGGYTAYADAIDKAQAELTANGRPDAEHDIVFFTDGAANYGPSYYPTTSPYRTTPCHQGINSANAAKGRGTIVYAIGYTLNAMGGGSNRCQSMSPSGPDESPAITAYTALSQIASRSDTFFNQPTAGSLNAIFARVASMITGPRLVDDNLP